MVPALNRYQYVHKDCGNGRIAWKYIHKNAFNSQNDAIVYSSLVLEADFFLYNRLHANVCDMNWDTQLGIDGLDLDADLTRAANIYKGTEHVENITSQT